MQENSQSASHLINVEYLWHAQRRLVNQESGRGRGFSHAEQLISELPHISFHYKSWPEKASTSEIEPGMWKKKKEIGHQQGKKNVPPRSAGRFVVFRLYTSDSSESLTNLS